MSGGIITTVAGNGSGGFGGDGGPATSASLIPAGVAVDSAGSLYIADVNSSRIRKVSGGTITTIAGGGAFRFSGDGGPATSALLNTPEGLTLDSAGNLYIADFANKRVRGYPLGRSRRSPEMEPSDSPMTRFTMSGLPE